MSNKCIYFVDDIIFHADVSLSVAMIEATEIPNGIKHCAIIQNVTAKEKKNLSKIIANPESGKKRKMPEPT